MRRPCCAITSWAPATAEYRDRASPKAMTAAFLAAAFAVVLPRFAWTMLEAYVLKGAGGELGAGLGFVAVYVGIAGAISGLVASALVGISRALGNLVPSRRVYTTSALIGGLALSGGTFLIPSLATHAVGCSLLGDIASMAVNWAAISSVVLAASYLGVLRSGPGSHAG